jgi:PAS domain-containing protein
MGQRNLVLILARDLADKLATATFLVDHDGKLVYYNERAAEILGESFGEAGRMSMEEWSRTWSPMDRDGRELSPEELPLVIALRDKRPAHRVLLIRGQDGVSREIAITALPFFARKGELVGAAAVFWEHPPVLPEGVDE